MCGILCQFIQLLQSYTEKMEFFNFYYICETTISDYEIIIKCMGGEGVLGDKIVIYAYDRQTVHQKMNQDLKLTSRSMEKSLNNQQGDSFLRLLRCCRYIILIRFNSPKYKNRRQRIALSVGRKNVSLLRIFVWRMYKMSL